MRGRRVGRRWPFSARWATRGGETRRPPSGRPLIGPGAASAPTPTTPTPTPACRTAQLDAVAAPLAALRHEHGTQHSSTPASSAPPAPRLPARALSSHRPEGERRRPRRSRNGSRNRAAGDPRVPGAAPNAKDAQHSAPRRAKRVPGLCARCASDKRDNYSISCCCSAAGAVAAAVGRPPPSASVSIGQHQRAPTNDPVAVHLAAILRAGHGSGVRLARACGALCERPHSLTHAGPGAADRGSPASAGPGAAATPKADAEGRAVSSAKKKRPPLRDAADQTLAGGPAGWAGLTHARTRSAHSSHALALTRRPLLATPRHAAGRPAGGK